MSCARSLATSTCVASLALGAQTAWASDRTKSQQASNPPRQAALKSVEYGATSASLPSDASDAAVWDDPSARGWKDQQAQAKDLMRPATTINLPPGVSASPTSAGPGLTTPPRWIELQGLPTPRKTVR